MSTWVVTGAAGFVGSHLVEALLARGDEVRAVDAFTDYYDRALKEENARVFDVVELDLADVPLDLDGVDGVFHLAAQPGVRASFDRFDLYVRHNLVATQRVFEAAAGAGVRVLFASSSSIYGDAERYPTPEDAPPEPISPYGVTKLACEHLAGAYARLGLDAVALRYFTVYGPRQRPDMAATRLVSALAAGTPFELFGDGSASRSFTYVADAVDATVRAMESAPTGAVYNVGGGEEATMRQVVDVLERVSGRTLDLRTGPSAPGDVRRTSADVTRIGRDLGWAPTTHLEDGLRAQWEWARDRVASR
jgi:nucleoside-diphosphate-sugar epimerase